MVPIHTLPQIPHGERAVLVVILVSAIAAALVPDLTVQDRVGALLVAPVMFMGNYFLARLILPLMGGTAAFGTKIATAAFYGSLVLAAVAIVCIPYWLVIDGDSAPMERAYRVGGAAPSALGWAAAAIQRYRRNILAA
jgi:hypothetical protein